MIASAVSDIGPLFAVTASFAAMIWLIVLRRQALRQASASPLPAGIGPHEGRELELMLAGRKPLAIASDGDYRHFDAAVRDGRLIAASVRVFVVYRRDGIIGLLVGKYIRRPVELRFYAQAAEQGRLQAICDIYARSGAGFTALEHATIGWLLGYSDVGVAAFLDHWQRQATNHCRGF